MGGSNILIVAAGWMVLTKDEEDARLTETRGCLNLNRPFYAVQMWKNWESLLNGNGGDN